MESPNQEIMGKKYMYILILSKSLDSFKYWFFSGIFMYYKIYDKFSP